jgi:hypothetical protein
MQTRLLGVFAAFLECVNENIQRSRLSLNQALLYGDRFFWIIQLENSGSDRTSQNEHSILKQGNTIMKLPIQSQPILRNVSTARINYYSSMIHPQESCDKSLVGRWKACRETFWRKEDKPALNACRMAEAAACAWDPASCEC